MNPIEIFLLLVAMFLASRLFKKRLPGPLPPGPRGIPILGSALSIPMEYHWIHFSKWSERWGKYYTPISPSSKRTYR